MLGYLIGRVQAVWKERGRFPQAAAGPTPAVGTCCAKGGQCPASPDAWSAPAWRLLDFSVDGPHRYAYQYELASGGQVAVLRAIGDLDCDGVVGTYEVRLTPSGTGLTETWTRNLPEE